MEEDKKSNQEFFVDVVGWLETGWYVYKRNWMSFSMSAFIFLAIIITAQILPYAGNLLVMGPMTIGFFMVTAEIVAGREFNPGTLFAGFKYFIPAFIAHLLITIFTTIGFIFLIIPGIVVGGLYIFTYLFIADRKLDYWESMEASRKVASKDVVGFAIFYFAMGAVNVVGLLFMVVGVLVTLPVTMIAMFVAYEKLVGFESLLKEPEEGDKGESDSTEPPESGRAESESAESPPTEPAEGTEKSPE